MATRKSKLETVFTGDAKPFERTAARVQSVGKKVSGIGKSMMGGFAAIGGTMLAKSTLEKYDRIGKLSKQFNMPAEALQRLGHVANLGGSNIEVVAKGMSQLNMASSDAAKGMKTYTDEFEALGLDAQEFFALDHEERWIAMSEAVAKASDRNRAQAATQKLMGRAGKELFVIMEQGGAVQRDQMKEIAVATGDQVAAIEDLNDTFSMLATSGLAKFAGVLGDVWDFMKGIAEWAGIIAGVVGSWAGGMTLEESLQAGADTHLRIQEQKRKDKEAREARGQPKPGDGAKAPPPLVAKAAKAVAQQASNIFDPSTMGGFFGHAGRKGTPVSRQVKSLQEKMLDIGMRSKDEIADMHKTLRNALI